jgi:2-oxoglutarate dehydrogenase E1 component
VKGRFFHYLYGVGLRAHLLSYWTCKSADAEIVWAQEEPMNMGAYTYVSPRMATALRKVNRGTFEDIKYAGRPPSAATATGFGSLHAKEQKEVLQKAIDMS